MVKLILLAACLISTLIHSTASNDIVCDYNTKLKYKVVGKIYVCSVYNDPNIITKEEAQLIDVSGNHQKLKGNDYVLGFTADYKTIQFFPIGLKAYFKNLKLIFIGSSSLKEIHQSDLKVFPKLVYFYLIDNEIEVIEEGLFDFNPDLNLVGFEESNIIHIDPVVFDNLNNLRYFWFSNVPCVNKKISDSLENVQTAIKVVKSNCTNLEFSDFEKQIEKLEIESITVDSNKQDLKFLTLEKKIKSTNFFNFRPFNYKIESLKSEKCSSCRQLEKIVGLDTKIVYMSKSLKGVANITESLKISQCGLRAPFDELKSSQISLFTALNGVKSSVNNNESKRTQFQNFLSNFLKNVLNKINEVNFAQKNLKELVDTNINDLKSSQSNSINTLGVKLDKTQEMHEAAFGNLKNTQMAMSFSLSQLRSSQNSSYTVISGIKLSQDNLKASLENLKITQKSLIASQDSSLFNLTSKFNELKKDIKSTQDETKLSLNDIEVKLSDNKKFQAEVKDSFIKVRSMQNEMKMALNDLSVNRNDGDLSGLNEKVDNMENHLNEIKTENVDKFSQIEREINKKFHKMSINFDEKIKGIEKRMLKKFEEILEEKLEKYFNQKN